MIGSRVKNVAAKLILRALGLKPFDNTTSYQQICPPQKKILTVPGQLRLVSAGASTLRGWAMAALRWMMQT